MKLEDLYNDLHKEKAVICEHCGCRHHPFLDDCPACLARESFDEEAFKNGQRAIPITMEVDRVDAENE
jgi:uncharacterized OB-fold protein